MSRSLAEVDSHPSKHFICLSLLWLLPVPHTLHCRPSAPSPLPVQLITQEVWGRLEVMYHYCSQSFSAQCLQHLMVNGGHRLFPNILLWMITTKQCVSLDSGFLNRSSLLKRAVFILLFESVFIFLYVVIDMSKHYYIGYSLFFSG